MLRQRVQLAVVAADAQHRGPGMFMTQAAQGIPQGVAADVESYEQIAVQGLQQWRHLAGIADAEFHQYAFPDGSGDRIGPLVQQSDFSAGQAVFRLFANGSEQFGAFAVVKQPGRQLAWSALHSLPHQGLQVGLGWMQIQQFHIHVVPGHRASRMPPPIQRLVGGKKLR